MKIFLITFILMIVVSSAEEKDNTFQINDEIVQIEDSNEIGYMNDVSEIPTDDKIGDKIDDDDDIFKKFISEEKNPDYLTDEEDKFIKAFLEQEEYVEWRKNLNNVKNYITQHVFDLSETVPVFETVYDFFFVCPTLEIDLQLFEIKNGVYMTSKVGAELNEYYAVLLFDFELKLVNLYNDIVDIHYKERERLLQKQKQMNKIPKPFNLLTEILITEKDYFIDQFKAHKSIIKGVLKTIDQIVLKRKIQKMIEGEDYDKFEIGFPHNITVAKRCAEVLYNLLTTEDKKIFEQSKCSKHNWFTRNVSQTGEWKSKKYPTWNGNDIYLSYEKGCYFEIDK